MTSAKRTTERTAELEAGRVGRAHGLDGSFYVTHPRPRLLAPGVEVSVGELTGEIVRRAGTDRNPIVRVSGVDDRAGAQALRGLPVRVAGEDAPALAEDEWWAHELEGCLVRDGERRVGTVVRMIELPSCEALEVTPATVEARTGGGAGKAPGGGAGGTAGGGTEETVEVGSPARTGEPLLVPMVRDAIRNIDVRAGVIEVNMTFIEE